MARISPLDGRSARPKVVHKTVTYLQTGRRQELAADRAICTVPLTVLRDMEVSPPFSIMKRRAIQELPYASACRITLQVRQRYWAENGLNGFADADFPGEIWHPTFDRSGPRALLQLYPKLGAARRLERLPDSARLAAAAEMVDQVFPGLHPHLDGGATKCWTEEEVDAAE